MMPAGAAHDPWSDPERPDRGRPAPCDQGACSRTSRRERSLERSVGCRVLGVRDPLGATSDRTRRVGAARHLHADGRVVDEDTRRVDVRCLRLLDLVPFASRICFGGRAGDVDGRVADSLMSRSATSSRRRKASRLRRSGALEPPSASCHSLYRSVLGPATCANVMDTLRRKRFRQIDTRRGPC